MRMRILLPVLLLPALLAFSAGDARAGSFFGPDLYGARYTARYPNRSHNVFGCGPDCRCSAWHGFCRHRFVRRHRGTPNEGMPANVMPGNAMPVSGTPITGVSTEYMHGQVPITQLPMATVPVRMTSGTPAQVVATPAVQSRIVPVPVPAPLPSGPVTAEPPHAEPPF